MTTKKLGEGATPGPWTVSNEKEIGRHVCVVDEQDVTVCRVYQQPYDTWNAKDTARLISRAPLLVEAREVLARLADIGSTQELPRRIRDLAHEARALLQKLDAE